MKMKANRKFSVADTDRIIEMAWEDRTPFEAIFIQFGLNEAEVKEMMRKEMMRSSFNMWRKRMKGRITKHSLLRNPETLAFKSRMQKQIALNKISKR